MAGPPDILAKLDAIAALVAALRAEVAGEELFVPEVQTADDLAPEHMLDTTSAGARFNCPRNTLAKWAREEGIGVRQGGRWLISVPKLRRRLNGS